ncbi:MAG TPA: hypothetical protein VF691_04695 [Cytophagaceae bacterium]
MGKLIFVFTLSILVLVGGCKKKDSSPPTPTLMTNGLKGVTTFIQTATDIYVTTFDATSGGGISKVPKGGGSPVQIAKDDRSLRGLFADEKNIYWITSDSTLYSMSINADVPIKISEGFGGSMNYYGGQVHNNYVYTVDPVLKGRLIRLPLNSREPDVLITDQLYPHSLLINNEDLYWATLAGAEIKKASLNDLKVVVLTNSIKALTLEQEAGFLYWYNDMSIERNNTQPRRFSISKMPISGGAIQVLRSDEKTIEGFGVRGGKIYWASEGRVQSMSTLGQDYKILASNLDSIKGLLVDDFFVYILHGVQLSRISSR